MKKMFITICAGSLLIMLTFLMAEETHENERGFFKINDNIQNEELRAELEILREKFAMEGEEIRESYNEKIALLKESRKREIHDMKNKFAAQRKELMKTYMGKMRAKPKGDAPKKMLNKPTKVKPPKEKMKKRKY